MGLVSRALIGGGKQTPPVKPFRSWPRLIAYTGESEGISIPATMVVSLVIWVYSAAKTKDIGARKRAVRGGKMTVRLENVPSQ